MSVRGLREAFNSVSQPKYLCGMALLDYERSHDTEWQVLRFSGRRADGVEFAVTSEKLRPNTDLLEAAKATAQALLNSEEPLA